MCIYTGETRFNEILGTMKFCLLYQMFCYTVEPRYNVVLGTRDKLPSLYQVSHCIFTRES